MSELRESVSDTIGRPTFILTPAHKDQLPAAAKLKLDADMQQAQAISIVVS